jgi:alditol oxidase
VTTNWAGNYRYRARRIARPASLSELQSIVAGSDRVRALGSGHSFTALPDSEGTLVRLDALAPEIDVDARARTVSVGGGVTYGVLAPELHRAGFALPNLASLPHISIAGAVATGTHGSGDANQNLAGSVRSIDIIGPGGDIRTVHRGGPDFDGSVVALGALGVASRLVLDVQPTYDVSSYQFVGLTWEMLGAHLDELMACSYSVSLFTHWTEGIDQVWVKSRSSRPPLELFGARQSQVTLHMLEAAPTAAVTEQLGTPGPWHERLPHFRLEFTPSRGEELQSEYFLPRPQAPAVIRELRLLAPRLAPVLQVSEVRTVAADDLWLSGSYGRDSLAIHFTWDRDPVAVSAVLPLIEEALLPLGARPHWGKCFSAGPGVVAAACPRIRDFAALRSAVDPEGKFSNVFLDSLLESF